MAQGERGEARERRAKADESAIPEAAGNADKPEGTAKADEQLPSEDAAEADEGVAAERPGTADKTPRPGEPTGTADKAPGVGEPTGTAEDTAAPGATSATDGTADETVGPAKPTGAADDTVGPDAATGRADETAEPREPIGRADETADPREATGVVDKTVRPDAATTWEQDAAGAEAAEPRRRSGWALWPWLVILIAAGLGLALGNALGTREGSLFPELGSGSAARPTIVIGAAPQAASPVALSSPSPVQSPVAPREEEYVVQPGDSLRSIAQRLYGDQELWSRVYERNRDVIGPNPNALQPGMRLRVPRD